MSVIRGVAKYEISKELPFFSDRDDFKSIHKINVGDDVSIYQDENGYYYFMRFHKFYILYDEIDSWLDVYFEDDCFNTCIRNGTPCKNIKSKIDEGFTNRTKRTITCCKISWEVGRASCCNYEIE